MTSEQKKYLRDRVNVAAERLRDHLQAPFATPYESSKQPRPIRRLLREAQRLERRASQLEAQVQRWRKAMRRKWDRMGAEVAELRRPVDEIRIMDDAKRAAGAVKAFEAMVARRIKRKK